MVHRFLARRVAAAAALLCVALTSAKAWSFCRTTTCSPSNAPAYCAENPATGCALYGAPLFWEQGCVSFSVEWNGSPGLGLTYIEAEQLITQAFQRWLTVDCTTPPFEFPNPPAIAVTSLGPTWCERKEFNPEGPNSNAVIFVDQGWTGPSVALAITTVSFNAKTGLIYGADLEINSENYDLDVNQLSYVLTHEAGHYLGLDHSKEPDALMNETYALGGAEVALGADDIEAICAAYDPSRPVTRTCNPEPDNGYSPDCGGDVEVGCALAPARSPSVFAGAALGVLAALFAFRRRSRPLAS